MPLLFRQLHAKLDKIDETIERNNAAFERMDAAFQDLQVVIRENRLLQQRSLEHFEAFVDRINADAEARMAGFRRMLDRWGEGPTPAS